MVLQSELESVLSESDWPGVRVPFIGQSYYYWSTRLWVVSTRTRYEMKLLPRIIVCGLQGEWVTIRRGEWLSAMNEWKGTKKWKVQRRRKGGLIGNCLKCCITILFVFLAFELLEPLILMTPLKSISKFIPDYQKIPGNLIYGNSIA